MTLTMPETATSGPGAICPGCCQPYFGARCPGCTALHQFGIAHQAHAGLVHRIIRAGLRPGDADWADDIAQDVWLAYWRRLLSGRPIDRPAGLLVTLARRRTVDHYRSAATRRERPTDPTTSALDRLVTYLETVS